MGKHVIVHRRLIYSDETFQQAVAYLSKAEEVAVDVETSGAVFAHGLKPYKGWLVGVGFGMRRRARPDEIWAFYLPLKTRDPNYTGKLFTEFYHLAALIDCVPQGTTWFMHNAKFDLKWLEQACQFRWVAQELRDPMIERYMYNPDGKKNLKLLTSTFYPERVPPTTFDDLVATGKKGQKFLEDVDLTELARYCMDDCANTLLVGDRTAADLKAFDDNKKLWYLYRNLEMPVMRLLTDMEVRGVQIDTDGLDELATSLYEKKEAIDKKLTAFADINWNSNKQVVELLKRLHINLPNVKTPTGNQKLDRAVLDSIAGKHDCIDMMLLSKDLGKLLSTYIEGIYKSLDDAGRLHGEFNQTNARTGRLSSSGPNLQNIPARKKAGALVNEYLALRRLFIGTNGHPLLIADLSQIEMRFAAHFSQDPSLLHIYTNDLDLHEFTSRTVTNGDRTLAKNVNFGFLYGQRTHGLANLTGMSLKEAGKFIANFERQFKELVLWTRRAESHARVNGYAETILGRRRPLPDIRSLDMAKRSRAARQAVNTIIQGSAADYLKVAMLNIEQDLRKHGVYTVLQVHDELVFDIEGPITKECIDMSMETIKKHMEHAIPLSVPVRTEPSIINNWAEGK